MQFFALKKLRDKYCFLICKLYSIFMPRDVAIIVACHKKYAMPFAPGGSIFVPMQCGRACPGKVALTDADIPGIIGDDTGENRSQDNPVLAEASGIYWLWKNMERLGNPAYVGLAHYRRFLGFGCPNPSHEFSEGQPINVSFGERMITDTVKQNDIIMPKPFQLEEGTVLAEYTRNHYPEDLLLCHSLIAARDPQAGDVAKQVLAQTSTYPCNMFVMRRELFDDYAGFLFGVLDDLQAQRKLDWYAQNGAQGQTNPQARMLGFAAERLTHIWYSLQRARNPALKTLELPLVFSEEVRNPADGRAQLNFTAQAKQPSYAKLPGFEQLSPKAITDPSPDFPF